MGKKKDKQLKAQAAGANWSVVDHDPVGFLVAPQSTAEFWESTWERAPRLYPATAARNSLLTGLCTLPALRPLLQAREGAPGGPGPLVWGRDVTGARYRGGVRDSPAAEVGDWASLSRLHDKDGATLQLLQPQRWLDPLWRLLAAMEVQLGCLVGANAYLTPAGCQGLAPHYDDVELWVVQTGGSKAWRLYNPLPGQELANAPSPDFDPSVLGEPVMEVTLQPGDVLYLPRGTPHQAVAGSGGASTHVTISTYQRWSLGDLAAQLVAAALHGPPEECVLPLDMRRGPLPGMVHAHSLQHLLKAGPGGSPLDAARLAQALRALASSVEGEPELLTDGAHAMAGDFLVSRLPPHPKQLPAQGPPPELGDSIHMRGGSRLYYLLPVEMPAGGGSDDDDDDEEEEEKDEEEEEEEEEEDSEDEEGRPAGRQVGGAKQAGDEDEDADEDEEDEEEEEDDEEGGGGGATEPAYKLVSCLGNSREGHMMGGAGALAGAHGDEEEGEEEDEEEGGGMRAGPSGRPAHLSDTRPLAQPPGNGCAQGTCGHDHSHYGEGGGHHHQEGAELAEVEMDRPQAGSGPGAWMYDMPGVVFPGEVGPALVAVLQAEGPGTAMPVSSLPLAHDADKLRLAFALWAEGYVSTVKRRGDKAAGQGGAQQQQQQRNGSGGGGGSKKQKRRPEEQQQQQGGQHASGRPSKKAKGRA